MHGAGIVKNSSTKIIGQQPGDMSALRDHLHLNETALNQIKHFSAPVKGKSADALLVIGEKAETTHTIRMSPTPVDYWIMTTYARESGLSVLVVGTEQRPDSNRSLPPLGENSRFGLADLDLLPEELSGEVAKGAAHMTKIIAGWTTQEPVRCASDSGSDRDGADLGAGWRAAAGLGDLLSLIKTITSTLQKPVGGVLSEIQKINPAINKFRQEIVWPLNEINQARAFVSATRARYTGLMSQIQSIRNNSANLANPRQMESALRSGQAEEWDSSSGCTRKSTQPCRNPMQPSQCSAT